jgi:hypothetical protein
MYDPFRNLNKTDDMAPTFSACSLPETQLIVDKYITIHSYALGLYMRNIQLK